MKSPKSVILGSSIYSIIIGVIWIVLSIYSLFAYDCDFDFTQSPFMYMLYLLYFKAAQCDRFVDWKLLGLNTNATKIQPDMPLETLAVFRTFVFSSTYLLLNIMLVITAVLALCKFFLVPCFEIQLTKFLICFCSWFKENKTRKSFCFCSLFSTIDCC